jgi:hypothetical protein
MHTLHARRVQRLDASVFSFIPAAHLQAPAVIVAEKCADFLSRANDTLVFIDIVSSVSIDRIIISGLALRLIYMTVSRRKREQIVLRILYPALHFPASFSTVHPFYPPPLESQKFRRP